MDSELPLQGEIPDSQRSETDSIVFINIPETQAKTSPHEEYALSSAKPLHAKPEVVDKPRQKKRKVGLKKSPAKINRDIDFLIRPEETSELLVINKVPLYKPVVMPTIQPD